MERPSAVQIRHRAFEMVSRAGHSLLPLSEVVRTEPGCQRTIVHPLTDSAAHAIAVLDLVLDREGNVRLIEANGSNAGATSFASDRGDAPRIDHFVESFEQILTADGRGVIAIGYAPGTGLLHEIVDRSAGIAERLLAKTSVALRDTGEALGEEHVTVVCGPIPNLAEWMTRPGRLHYRDARVLAISNANLLPELARRGLTRAAPTSTGYDLVMPVHDGPLCWLTHDRAEQQRVAIGTGLKPQSVSIAHSIGEAEEVLGRMVVEHDVFGKINGASGGAGVIPIRRHASATQVRQAIMELLASASSAYGKNAEVTAWPLRFFEATFSTGYELDGNEHLWDMRFLCLVRPDRVEVMPADMRLCPEPFDVSVLSRDMVVANTTGRSPSVRFMRCPLARHARGTHLEMHHAGVDDDTLERMCRAAASWCEKACRSRESLALDPV